MAISFSEIKDASLIANDGEFIGEVTGEFCVKSLINEFGPHGGIYGVKSISNEFCVYGDPSSELSPHNKASQIPPKLMKDDNLIAYVTKNDSFSPRIDPDALLNQIRNEKIAP